MEQKFCQSCGMPLTNDILGTNADQIKNEDYCIYCYKDGAFTGDYTMEQMVEYCSQFVEEYNKHTGQNLTVCQYKDVLRQYYPTLKRWNGGSLPTGVSGSLPTGEGGGRGRIYMTLVINTLEDNPCNKQIETLLGNKESQFKIIDTKGLDIRHCAGCNACWLKTPGRCAIKDDYIQVVKQLVTTEDLWLVTDTRFGFLDYRGKRIMDRIMPMLNMNIEFRDGWMRHQLRYHALNIGVLYRGDGDHELLAEWCERCAMNLGGKSLGVMSLDLIGKEVASCM